MYNEPQKQRYLEYCRGIYDANTVKNIESKFSVCEWIEIERQKDISLFTKYEIDEYLYTIGVKSTPGSLSAIVSYYSKYTTWCIQNSLVPSGINHFEELVGEGKFEKYLNKRIAKRKYITLSDIKEVTTKLINPRDQFVVACLYEFGASKNQEEIMSIRKEDINHEKHTIKLISGREPVISPMLLRIAEAAAETDYYVTETYEGVKRDYDLERSEFIYRNVCRSTPMSNNANQKMYKLLLLAKRSSNMDESVTANTISDSGLFMFITAESEKLGMDPVTYIKTHNDVLLNQYNKDSSRSLAIYRKLKTLLS